MSIQLSSEKKDDVSQAYFVNVERFHLSGSSSFLIAGMEYCRPSPFSGLHNADLFALHDCRNLDTGHACGGKFHNVSGSSRALQCDLERVHLHDPQLRHAE